jgi:CRP-like cAMP-binding protein
VDVQVGASYDSPPNVVRDTILEAIRHEPLLARDRKPEVLVADFGDSAIKYLVRVWTTDFSADLKLRDRIRTQIYYAFRRRGITIPYPIQVQLPGPPIEPATDRASLDVAVGRAQIFASLSPAQRTELLETARPNLYGAGEMIVCEGDAGSSMFVIVRGQAAVTLAAAADPIARLGAGDFFGEMSLLTGEPRTATVAATTDCDVIEVTADGFRSFLMAEPSVAEMIAAAVEKRRAELAQARAAGSETTVSEQPRSLIARMRQFLRLTQ